MWIHRQELIYLNTAKRRCLSPRQDRLFRPTRRFACHRRYHIHSEIIQYSGLSDLRSASAMKLPNYFSIDRRQEQMSATCWW